MKIKSRTINKRSLFYNHKKEGSLLQRIKKMIQTERKSPRLVNRAIPLLVFAVLTSLFFFSCKDDKDDISTKYSGKAKLLQMYCQESFEQVRQDLELKGFVVDSSNRKSMISKTPPSFYYDYFSKNGKEYILIESKNDDVYSAQYTVKGNAELLDSFLVYSQESLNLLQPISRYEGSINTNSFSSHLDFLSYYNKYSNIANATMIELYIKELSMFKIQYLDNNNSTTSKKQVVLNFDNDL